MGCLFVIILGGVSVGSIAFFGYKAWLLIALGMLWFTAGIISFIGGHRGFGGGPRTDFLIVIAGIGIAAAIVIPKYNEQKPCYQARAALKQLVDAEHEYFAKHKTFTSDINRLNFEQNPQLYIMMLRGDEKSFAFSLCHLSCDDNKDGTPDVLMWDTLRGGLW